MEAELLGQRQKKEQLESDIALCSVKLERATKLIGGLGGERARWEQAALLLAQAQEALTGDMLVSAGIIAYLGAFTAAFRTHLVDAFLDLCSKAVRADADSRSCTQHSRAPVQLHVLCRPC